MADDPQDAARHAGHVVRRVLLRRNIAIDAETAQLVAAAVQAALQSRCALPAAAPRKGSPGAWPPIGLRLPGSTSHHGGHKHGRSSRFLID